jgi:glycosyltransferase involved in cell wall biosynthesis
MGCRVIVTHHSDLVLTTGPMEKTGGGVARWSGIAAARVANRLVTYTHDRAAVSPTVTRSGPNVTIIPPPVTVEPTTPERGAAFRERFDLGPGPVVGFAGRFAIEKGIDVLLKTLPILQQRWPDVRITMIGPDAGIDGALWTGPWDDLIAASNGAARKLGILTGQDLADYYAAIDVLYCPASTGRRRLASSRSKPCSVARRWWPAICPACGNRRCSPAWAASLRRETSMSWPRRSHDVIANRANYVQTCG